MSESGEPGGPGGPGEPGAPVRREGVLAQEAHGTTVLLRLSDGGYYALDEVGAFIWARCDGRHSLEDLVVEVVAEFDAPEEVVRADVREFVGELVSEGLLVASA